MDLLSLGDRCQDTRSVPSAGTQHHVRLLAWTGTTYLLAWICGGLRLAV